MDPLTQGLLGAAASQSLFARRLGRPVVWVGLAAGMAADADILIRSQAEPMLAMIYHRHFTHSLVFIPVGAAVAAAAFLLLPWGRRKAPWIYAAALAAYATHGLLDAATSYGTLWLWPFSQRRLAWDLLSIIDPLFTLILLAGVVAAVIWRQAMPARLALLAAALYVGIAAVQHQRAQQASLAVAAQRGSVVQRHRVMPALGRAWRWRSIYVSNASIWADEVRTPLTGPAYVIPGEQATLVTLQQARELAAPGVFAARAIDRFYWFADGFVGVASTQPLVLTDLRYSLRPTQVKPLWGLLLDPARLPAGYAWVSLGHGPHSILKAFVDQPEADGPH